MEEAIYMTNGVEVYKSKVSVNGVTFFIKNISSVAVNVKSIPERTRNNGFGIGCISYIVIAAILVGFRWGNNFTWAMAIIVPIVLFFIFKNRIIKVSEAYKQYSISFDTNSGKFNFYDTRNSQEANAIKSAIELAVQSN